MTTANKQTGSGLTIYILALQIMTVEELLSSELGNHKGRGKTLLDNAIRSVKQFNLHAKRIFNFDLFEEEQNRFIFTDFCEHLIKHGNDEKTARIMAFARNEIDGLNKDYHIEFVDHEESN